MQCLKNFIQIEGCDAPAYSYTVESVVQVASGLYINKDLPISLEEINSLADGEQLTFIKVWDEVQIRGIRKFISRVRGGYQELFNVCHLADDWFCENRMKLALPLLYCLGAELMIEKLFSTRINRFTRSFDKARGQEMREEFEAEFSKYLRDALGAIGHEEEKVEGGQIYSYVTVLP